MTKTKPRKKTTKIMPLTQSGSVAKIRPACFYDAENGDLISVESAEKNYVLPFLELIASKTEEMATRYGQQVLENAITNKSNTGTQPTGIAWKHGIRTAWEENEQYLAMSRIEKICQHNLISICKSYIENTDKNKELPNYHVLKANIGAADKQIATVDHLIKDDGMHVFLLWKCLTKELIIEFVVPEFINKYDISKYCLPTVYYDDEKSQVLYDFPFVEDLHYERVLNRCYAAYDLGIVEPFVLTIANHHGKVIATKKASSRLKRVNNKRQRLMAEKKRVSEKIAAYEALGVVNDKLDRLVENKRGLAGKIARLGGAVARLSGFEIARACSRAGVSFCGGEDLSWVSEEKGSSRWVHGKMSEWARRECNRAGSGFLLVSAKDSSRKCSCCGGEVREVSERVLECVVCGSRVDRDVSASRVLCSRVRGRVRAYLVKCYGSCVRLRC